MSAKAERNMQITPDTLTDRAEVVPRVEVADAEALRAELETLRSRMTAAATLEPQPHELHCRDCFHRGRNAVLRTLTGKDRAT